MKRKPNKTSCFGDRLREVRRERGYSMEQLCELFNKTQSSIKLNKSTVSRYENSTQEPMLSTVAALADFLGVSPVYLIGDSDNRNCSMSNMHNCSVVQGNNAKTLIIKNSNLEDHGLSDQAAELVRVFESLGIREQTELLSFAFQLENRAKK